MKVYIEMDTDIDYKARDFGEVPNDIRFVANVFSSKKACEQHYSYMRKAHLNRLINSLEELEVIEEK